MSDRHERDDGAALPFDVEIERFPAWVHVLAALVIVVGVLVATKIVHILVFLPFLVAGSIARRFASTAAHVEVNEDGLDLGGRAIHRAEIADVWVDDDEREPRVTVAFGQDVELAILHFCNREQARRFGGALASRDIATRLSPVVGYLPRPVDWLSSLRFVAIAAAFFGTGSALGALVLGIFAVGAWTNLRATQVIAREDRVELRTLLGVRVHRYSEIERVEVDDGVIHLRGGAEVAVPRAALRDATLASRSWLERARRRAFGRIASAARERRA